MSERRILALLDPALRRSEDCLIRSAEGLPRGEGESYGLSLARATTRHRRFVEVPVAERLRVSAASA